VRSVRVRRKRSAHDARALLGLPAGLCGPVERGELSLDEALKLAKPAEASVALHEELRRRGGAEASPGYEDFLSPTPRLSRLELLDAEIERLSKGVDLLKHLAGLPRDDTDEIRRQLTRARKQRQRLTRKRTRLLATQQGREQAGRASFRREWREKYRNDIDCPRLRFAASVKLADDERFERAAALRAGELATFLEEHEAKLERFLREPVRGSSVSLEERARLEHERREAFAALRPTPGKVVEAQLAAYQEDLRRFRELLGEMARGAPRPRTRDADAALGRAAAQVATWIRERHRDKHGELDRKVLWSDVEQCLRWHGHDLPSNPAEALRNLALQYARRSKKPPR
jgi:hypothetical protein